jgi:hypothetical protein
LELEDEEPPPQLIAVRRAMLKQKFPSTLGPGENCIMVLCCALLAFEGLDDKAT